MTKFLILCRAIRNPGKTTDFNLLDRVNNIFGNFTIYCKYLIKINYAPFSVGNLPTSLNADMGI